MKNTSSRISAGMRQKIKNEGVTADEVTPIHIIFIVYSCCRSVHDHLILALYSLGLHPILALNLLEK